MYINEIKAESLYRIIKQEFVQNWGNNF